jgi:drug/metabolite transporter (DMT)-like permease
VLVKLAAAPIEMICFWRLFAAGGILQIIGSFKGVRGDFLSKSSRWSLYSGLFFFLHLWTFVYAVQNTSVANSVILFSTNPIFTFLVSKYLIPDSKMKTQMLPRLWISYPLALAGILILMSNQNPLQSTTIKGDVVIVVSALLHSLYLLASRRARENSSNLEVSKIINLVAATFFLGFALLRGVPLQGFPDQTWLAIAALVAFPSLMGHSLITYLVNFFPVNVLSMSKLIEPIMSIGLAALMIGEGFTARVLVAFVVTALGLSILYWPESYWQAFSSKFFFFKRSKS